MEALLYFAHLRLHLLCKLQVGWGATYHKGHSGAVVYLYSYRARHTVAAATAELACQVGTVFLYYLLQLWSKLRLAPEEGYELVQLALPLDAPNWQKVAELQRVGIGRSGIVDKPSGKGFHCYKAHIALFAALYKRKFLLSGEVAEWELQSLIASALYCLPRYGEAVVGYAYVAYHSGCLGLQHCLVEPCAVSGEGTEGRIVELVYIYITALQVCQREPKVLPEALRCGGHCFGGYEDILSGIVLIYGEGAKGLSNLGLAVCVETGGVKEAEARIVCLVQQINCICARYSLYRQGAKTILWNGYACGAQCYCSSLFHMCKDIKNKDVSLGY